MRIVHLSDVHVWRYTWDPRRLASKRVLGVLDLLRGRAGRFPLDRIGSVVERVLGLNPDHILITGDLTTTALPSEFRDARRALAPLLADPVRATVIPGNHDRATTRSVSSRRFEEFFGEFLPARDFPWLKRLGEETGVLGLDAARSAVSPVGRLPLAQLEEARSLTADPRTRPRRLIVACHYPVAAPPAYQDELRKKRLENEDAVRAWLSTVGPHLYCCGHVHAAWAFAPPELPGELCLNAGAPLMRDPTGLRPPGFLEILLTGPSVTVTHHAWDGAGWVARALLQQPEFFAAAPAAGTPDS